MASLWQNPGLALDVNDSGSVTAGDALVVINWIRHNGGGELPPQRPSGADYVDTSGNMNATALDALLIVNALYRYRNQPPLVVGIDPASDADANGVILGQTVTLTGQSSPGLHIELSNSVGEVLDAVVADDFGRFDLSSSIEPGLSDLQITATDPLGQTTSTTRRIRQGDIALNWNATALNVVREWTTTSDDPYEDRIVPSKPPRVARNLAMIHAAMFDAIATIEGGYETYLPPLTAPDNVSSPAAAVSAAYTVSTALYPDADSLAYWNAARTESLAAIPDGPEKDAGVAFGQSVGEALLQVRLNDGSEAAEVYTHGDAPGDWQRTHPGYLPPLLPQWPDVQPFVVDDVTEFRPAAPPSLDSAAYAASVDQVMQLGAIDSESRTPEQTEIAIFWADGGGTFTPPGHWNAIAADVLSGRNLPLIESARTLALLNLALADAGIAAWDAKYHYDLWRPIDAIQRADEDGNDLTTASPAWRPLLVSPPFPTYTSGHSTFSGAADAVLTALLGDNVNFTSQTDSFSAPGQRPLDPDRVVTRHFTSFAQAAEESGISRVYGGIHFSFDNTAGLSAGRAVGQAIVGQSLQPLSDSN